MPCGSLCRNRLTGTPGSRRAEIERDLGPVMDLDQRRADPPQHPRDTRRVAQVGIGRPPWHGFDRNERRVREQRPGLLAPDDHGREPRLLIRHGRQAAGDQADRPRAAGAEALTGRQDDGDGAGRHGRGP